MVPLNGTYLHARVAPRAVGTSKTRQRTRGESPVISAERPQGTSVGKSVRSHEAPRHASGRGHFVDDYRLPGMLHAAVLRSPHPHARIVGFDVTEALGLPGMVAVLTPDDVRSMSRPFAPGRYAAGLRTPVPEYASAVDKVRYVGEPVAAVAARDAATAEDALDRIVVEYEPLPPVVGTSEAMRRDAPLLYEELGTNVPWRGAVSYGDVDAAFREAELVVRDRLKMHRYSSVPLETFACIASADPTNATLTVWVNAQVPDVIDDALREGLGLRDVRIIIPDIGGGFGQKIHLIRKYVLITALLSLKTSRPVKWVEDRSGHMMAGGHACAQEWDVEAAVQRDGTVLGLRVRETDDVGGSISTLTIHFTNKLNNLFNTYTTQHLSLEGSSVVTNKCPVVPNRGIGKPGMCFVWERTMDRVAQTLGMSPVEVRTVNLIPSDQFPYQTPNGNIYDSGDYAGMLRRAMERIGYEELREEQARLREQGRCLGVGLAVAVEPGGRNAARDLALFPGIKGVSGSGGVNGATIRLERSGMVTLLLGSPNCGQSHETTTSQIVGDVLGLSPDRISVISPFDSEVAPWGSAAANSGNNFHLYDIGAAHDAARKLRERILTLAGHLLNTDPEDLVLEDGAVSRRSRGTPDQDGVGPSHAPSPHSPTPRLTFAELGRVAYGNQALLPKGFEPGLQETSYYTFPHAEPFVVPDEQGRVRAQFTFSAAVHIAVVEVDPATGEVEVQRYLIVSDNGTIINPSVVDGQIYGSAAHGISVALGEAFVYDEDGRLLTLTLTDYGKSTALETPRIEVEHRPMPSPFTTLGQKAAGEGAAIPSPAAIASAVEDALQPFGVRVRELPLTPEAIWRLIGSSAR
ncbi:MAG: molybdopterin-dependent oxidoreductase [Chloroflexi bacterium]|nr:molybdopterin-dependent oxidoreductase [Chloroflexota bacterium]